MSNTRLTAEQRRAEQRRVVKARARDCCEYCRSPDRVAVKSFELEHIFPESLDGPTELDNLAYSCPGCNSFKSARLTGTNPETGEDVALFHPRQQRWREHFDWSEDFLRIKGLTPAGRATEATLRLNRDGVVALRELLRDAGEHPPPEPEAE